LPGRQQLQVEKDLPVNVYADIYIPNSFTPDGNGTNDIFRIPPGTTLNLQSFQIYNRYGEIVFRTTDINSGWDGTFKGVKSPAGAYTYIIRGTDLKGVVDIIGTVIILR
jgi:gliding motility-associated-like protein